MVLVVPPTAWETRKAQADLYRAGAALVEARGVDGVPRRDARGVPREPDAGLHARRCRRRCSPSLRAKGAADLARMLRGAAASDLPDPARLRGLEMPALVIATRGDPGPSALDGGELVELLPNAELRVLDDLLELGSVRDELARFLTAPGARFERARADRDRRLLARPLRRRARPTPTSRGCAASGRCTGSRHRTVAATGR